MSFWGGTSVDPDIWVTGTRDFPLGRPIGRLPWGAPREAPRVPEPEEWNPKTTFNPSLAFFVAAFFIAFAMLFRAESFCLCVLRKSF